HVRSPLSASAASWPPGPSGEPEGANLDTRRLPRGAWRARHESSRRSCAGGTRPPACHAPIGAPSVVLTLRRSYRGARRTAPPVVLLKGPIHTSEHRVRDGLGSRPVARLRKIRERARCLCTGRCRPLRRAARIGAGG